MSDNEIYLLIKYIKSVLWSVAKCLSYIEEARCLKVKQTNALVLYSELFTMGINSKQTSLNANYFYFKFRHDNRKSRPLEG